MSLSDFFPTDALPACDLTPRSLLLGPPGSGKTSLLLQLALNHARRGRSTLYVICGARDALATRPPARPRASNSGSGSDDAELVRLLTMIHVKYVESLSELRDLLTRLHLAEAMPPGVSVLPHGLILDGVCSLLAPRDVVAAHTSAELSLTSPAGPSPGRPEQRRAAMGLALALALASHATDLLDAAITPSLGNTAAVTSAGDGLDAATTLAACGCTSLVLVPSEPPESPRERTPDRALLVVSWPTPFAEVELANRWLPATFWATALGSSGLYRLECVRGTSTLNQESTVYRHASGKTLEMLPLEALDMLPPSATPALPRRSVAHAYSGSSFGGSQQACSQPPASAVY